jgi:hypothetical protein
VTTGALDDPSLVPGYASDIDAGWLGRLLDRLYPDIRVASVEVRELTNGTSSRIRLHAEYEPGGGQTPPADLFVKTCFYDNAFFEKNRLNRRVVSEGRFYSEVLPTLDVPAPRLHAFAADVAEGRFVLVLDDLQARGATWGHASSPIKPDAADVVLTHLAGLHARYWATPEIVAMDWVPTPHHDPSPESRLRWIRPGIDRLLLGRAGPVPTDMTDAEHLGRTLLALTAHISAGTITLLHGDPHLGNLAFLGSSEPVFTDWAVHRGHWVYDVAYFLPSALTVDDRRAHERALLRGYLDRLAAAGVEAPSFDDAWLAYRAQVLYGLMVWLPVPDQMQPDEVVTAYTTRQLTACRDLQTMAAVYALMG